MDLGVSVSEFSRFTRGHERFKGQAPVKMGRMLTRATRNRIGAGTQDSKQAEGNFATLPALFCCFYFNRRHSSLSSLSHSLSRPPLF